MLPASEISRPLFDEWNKYAGTLMDNDCHNVTTICLKSIESRHAGSQLSARSHFL